MAIILPNTRNAIGVPNRYSDLAAAGLRWTPPPVYRYDAYDVQGDTATLYASDIDLDDYQYNADSYDAAVLPDGYSAITGGGGSFLVGAVDSKLYYRDSGGIGLPTGSPSGVTRVAYKENTGSCLVIVSGDLHAYYIINGEAVSYLIDNTRKWTEISFCTGTDDPRCFAIGVADGKLMAVRVVLGDLYVHTLTSTTGWKIAGGIKGEDFLNSTGHRLTSLVIDLTGYLHQVYTTLTSQAGDGHDVFSPALSGALDLGDNWQAVSGYMKEIADWGAYGDPLPTITSASRMYGIQDDKLYSLRRDITHELGAPSKTQITEFSDWWKVVFVAPDEAVAIRRIAL